LAIVACADPSWTVGSSGAVSWKSGPWSFCASNTDCYSSVSSGITAMYAVRVFVLTAVLAGVLALFFTIGAFWRRVDSTLASKACVGLYIYMGIASFIAMMVWTCVLSVGQTLGGALIVDMIVMVFSFIGAMLSYTWMKAVEMAPKSDTFTSSGPIVNSTPSQGGAKAAIPKSYPTAAPTASAGKPSSPRAVTTGGGPGHPHNNKWGSWEEIYDAENIAYYFFNHSNGESLWEPPAGWPHAARA